MCCSAFKKLFYALLFAPDAHNELHGQELDETHLTAHGVAEDGDELFLPEILHGLRGDLVGAVPLIDIVNILIVLRDLLELGFYPAGADAHDVDTFRAQLTP